MNKQTPERVFLFALSYGSKLGVLRPEHNGPLPKLESSYKNLWRLIIYGLVERVVEEARC